MFSPIKLLYFVVIVSLITNQSNARFLQFITYNCYFYKFLINYNYESVVNTSRQPNTAWLNIRIYNGTQTENYNLKDGHSGLLSSPMFNVNLKTVIFIYGYLANMNSPITRNMVEGFLKKGNMNVLALDTLDYIQYNYLTAITNVRFIGDDLGVFLSKMVAGGLSASNIHLVGHSLGAHLAGFAGKTFTYTTGAKLGRISGLDVAGPCFYKESNNLRLYKTDADFVDVIHTDAGNFGIMDSIGHMDFWPNGGIKQPAAFSLMQSHNMSWWYYLSSLDNPSSFRAVQCSNIFEFFFYQCSNNHIANMGYEASLTGNSEGNYFLSTTHNYPYCLGDTGIYPFEFIKALWG